MLFNSYVFIILFLPITLIVHYYLVRQHPGKPVYFWLILCSLFFYGYYNVWYLFILIGSVLLNWTLSRLMFEPVKNPVLGKKTLMITAFALDLGALFVFKYIDFVISNINYLFDTSHHLFGIVLPLGISFFTFQQISFIVDSYRGETKDYKFHEYCLFVTFFPQLVAGPIVLHSEMIPQFRKRWVVKSVVRDIDWISFAGGIKCFTIGLFKKVIIADTLATLVDGGYADVLTLNSLEAWSVITGYTLQIYFDFSGYCDMAFGIAAMFGIKLPINFDSPYRSISITEFWKRWHMSLTRFLTQYVYIPLGGNRNGKLRTYINTIIVFLISGLWHGANWTFVAWGLLHGLGVSMERLLGSALEKIPKFIRWIVTFAFVNVTWVFFRAKSITEAFIMLKTAIIYKSGSIDNSLQNGINRADMKLIEQYIPYVSKHISNTNMILFWGGPLLIILLCKPVCKNYENFNKPITLGYCMLFLWGFFSLSYITPFLYFGF